MIKRKPLASFHKDSAVIKQGKLVKKGQIRTNWKVRFFKLQSGKLSYFAPTATVTPIKTIGLKGCQVRRRLDLNHSYAFEVFWEKPYRPASLMLRGASEDDVEDWIDCILRAASGIGASKDDFEVNATMRSSAPAHMLVASPDVRVMSEGFDENEMQQFRESVPAYAPPVAPQAHLLNSHPSALRTFSAPDDGLPRTSALAAPLGPKQVVGKPQFVASEAEARARIEQAQMQIELMKSATTTRANRAGSSPIAVGSSKTSPRRAVSPLAASSPIHTTSNSPPRLTLLDEPISMSASSDAAFSGGSQHTSSDPPSFTDTRVGADYSTPQPLRVAPTNSASTLYVPPANVDYSKLVVTPTDSSTASTSSNSASAGPPLADYSQPIAIAVNAPQHEQPYSSPSHARLQQATASALQRHASEPSGVSKRFRALQQQPKVASRRDFAVAQASLVRSSQSEESSKTYTDADYSDASTTSRLAGVLPRPQPAVFAGVIGGEHADARNNTGSPPVQIVASAPDAGPGKSKAELERNAKTRIEQAQAQINLMKMASASSPSGQAFGAVDSDIASTPETLAEAVPLPDVSKLEWLRQTKRELVSEADPRQMYDVDYERRLGKGGFGEVYYARDRATGVEVAIKQLQINKKNKMEYLLVETDLHARVSHHKNVVKFVDAFLLREEKAYWVVLEYIDGGTLHDLKELDSFQEKHACYVARQVLDALTYIHHTNRIHRDIKSQNVLIGEKGQVKLTDFGLAAQLTERVQQRKTMLGTADFMAPEILRGEQYGTKVDVWALGMLVHEMIRGATPFANYSDVKKILSKMETSGVPQLKKKKLSALARNFVELCTKMSPVERPSSVHLLNHPWFDNVGTGDVMLPVLKDFRTKSGGKSSGCTIQ